MSKYSKSDGKSIILQSISSAKRVESWMLFGTIILAHSENKKYDENKCSIGANRGGIMKEKKFQIRNSTVDFLVFTKQKSEDGIEVRIQDENVWLTQDGISHLFDKGRTTITEHLKRIFEEGELEENSVLQKF